MNFFDLNTLFVSRLGQYCNTGLQGLPSKPLHHLRQPKVFQRKGGQPRNKLDQIGME